MTPRVKHVGFWILVAGFILVISQLHGCAQLGMLSSQPTPAQIQACYGVLLAAANAHSIPSTQIANDELQLKATPPVLPADCVGKV